MVSPTVTVIGPLRVEWPDGSLGVEATCVSDPAHRSSKSDSTDDWICTTTAARPDRRNTEWRQRNEIVVRLAEKHGVPVPLNRTVATLMGLGEPHPTNDGQAGGLLRTK